MKLSLSLQQDVQSPELALKPAQLKKIVQVVLEHLNLSGDFELGIACVDEAESQRLNLAYRGKDKPTNVLSFSSDIPAAVLSLLEAKPLGDLVICIPIVLAESLAQHKTALAHFHHLLVHGILHLLGYDHELGEKEANEMEALEIAVLAKVGISNPYLSDESDTPNPSEIT